jgi:class 3 adenylate cyclase
MIDAPEIRYARAADGAHLAYQIVGDGEPTLLSIAGFTFSIDAIDDEPHWSAYDRRLASIGRLVRYDDRGIGLSDRTRSGPATLEGAVADALTVLDASDTGAAVVVTGGSRAAVGLLLAAEHPDRVSAIVVVHGAARLERAPDYPCGIPSEMLRWFVEAAPDPQASGTTDDLALLAPSLMGDPQYRRWWARASQRAASPTAARELLALNATTDVRDRLADIDTPTLVIHRRDNSFLRVGHGRYLAEHIAGSRYVELDGRDQVPWAGDADAVITEIERFLGAERGAGFERRVASLLFCDVVASTESAAELGDRGWRPRLDAHDLAVRGVVARCGGRVVKFLGDGMLGEFTTPSSAIAAAREIVASVELPVRVGLHVGEVEVRGDDVAGLGVHLAARVMGEAGSGEVVVSRTVVDLLVGSGTTFESRGEHTLKGVPGRWELFSLVG